LVPIDVTLRRVALRRDRAGGLREAPAGVKHSGRRISCSYSTLTDVVTSPEEARVAGRLAARLKTLTTRSLMFVDEIGYAPITWPGAMRFFRLTSRRYKQAAAVLTSNKGFERRVGLTPYSLRRSLRSKRDIFNRP
jgi:DNA replication protein DnaC